MPGRNVSTAATLNDSELVLRRELVASVQKLAGEIGERNMSCYPQLLAAADFIEKSFLDAALKPRRETFASLAHQALEHVTDQRRGRQGEDPRPDDALDDAPFHAAESFHRSDAHDRSGNDVRSG